MPKSKATGEESTMSDEQNDPTPDEEIPPGEAADEDDAVDAEDE
jgi:hypothetical protein